MNGDPLLTVENLTTHFHTDEGTVHAVDGVSFTVNESETVCLVGESGSGKSVTSESITRLINIPPGDIVDGSVRFKGRELTELGEKEIRAIRGGEIAHVFQNPQDALNPVYTAATQIGEVMKLHTDMDKRARRKRVVDLLDRVGLPNPASIADTYPHELSGGQKQRVIIAMALAGQPDLLIADEPTTALDVTIQAQILDLFAELQDEFGMAILFVTHDLGVVAQIADRVVVMYAGKIMERGGVDEVFDHTGHPYTRGLLECLPGRGGSTKSIGGDLPSATDPPDGCRFAPRCPYAIGDCELGDQPEPVPVDGNEDHVAGCIFHSPEYDRSHLSQQVEWGEGSMAADGGEET